MFSKQSWKRKSSRKNSNCVLGNVQKTTHWPFERPPTFVDLICCYFQMLCVHLRHKTSVQQRGWGRLSGNSQRAPTTGPFKLVSHSVTDEIDSRLRRLNKSFTRGASAYVFKEQHWALWSLRHFDDKGAKFHCDSGTTWAYAKQRNACFSINRAAFYWSVLLKGQRGANRPPKCTHKLSWTVH